MVGNLAPTTLISLAYNFKVTGLNALNSGGELNYWWFPYDVIKNMFTEIVTNFL